MEKITCSRCKGKGIVDSPVVYAGFPGGCYKCAMRGWVYKDKFDEAFYQSKGEFYGFSWEQFGKTVKRIGRHVESDLMVSRGTTVTKLTEEQARKFFARYGMETRIETKA